MKMTCCWVLLLALVGCVKERSDERLAVIRLQSELETSAVSRGVVVGETQLAGVQFLRRDGAAAPLSFSGATVLAGLRSAAGHIIFSGADPVYDKTAGLHSYFVAYHPKGVAASEIVKWPVDGKTDIVVSSVFDAGNEDNPITGPLVFKHRLAQLEVICKADTSKLVVEEVIQASWGAITKIELVDTPSELVYTYATNAVTRGATLSSLPLKNKDYDTDFEAVTLTTNTENTITAAGMFAPELATGKLKIKVYTEREPLGKQIEVQLKNGETVAGFEVGSRHTVTLLFNAAERQVLVLGTKVSDWAVGYRATPEINTPAGLMIVMEYGFLPFSIVGPLSGATFTSYNGYTGTVASGGNGAYYTTERTIYEKEKPYHRIEIAATDQGLGVNWAAARELCRNKGEGWRLPRASEMQWIFQNRVALNAVPGMLSLGSGFYWVGTEESLEQAWVVRFSAVGDAFAYPKTNENNHWARCVRER